MKCTYSPVAFMQAKSNRNVCPASWSLWLAGGQPRLSLPREKMERKSASSCSELGLVGDVEALWASQGKEGQGFACVTPAERPPAGESCFPRRPGSPCGEGHTCTNHVSMGAGGGCWETGILLQTLLISSNCQLWDVLIPRSLRCPLHWDQ